MKSKSNIVLVAVIALVVGFAFGFLVKGVASMHHPGMSHGDDHGHGHDHTPLEVTGPAPTVDIIVTEDRVGGHNIQILTTNFEFSPTEASGEHVEGHGHAHVYVDGHKLGRVYGEWYHLSDIPPGEHEVKVTLNSNNHKDLTVNGEVVSDTEMITVVSR